MPYYNKSEDWLHQSALLLEARPETTRITTKYHISPGWNIRKPKSNVAPQDTEMSSGNEAATKQALARADKPPRGHLVLKTYDPVSGATLKYRTSKAAEASRLVQMLGGPLGRRMAGLGRVEEDVVMADPPAPSESGTQTPIAMSGGVSVPVVQGGKAQGQGAGGGGAGGKGKKKKRGKS